MGLFARLNARVLAAVDARAGSSAWSRVRTDGDGLVLESVAGPTLVLAWSQITRIVALRRELHAGDQVSLLLELADERPVVEIAASCAGWMDLCAALDRLDGVTPFAQWHASVLLQPMGVPIAVWPAV